MTPIGIGIGSGFTGLPGTPAPPQDDPNVILGDACLGWYDASYELHNPDTAVSLCTNFSTGASALPDLSQPTGSKQFIIRSDPTVGKYWELDGTKYSGSTSIAGLAQPYFFFEAVRVAANPASNATVAGQSNAAGTTYVSNVGRVAVRAGATLQTPDTITLDTWSGIYAKVEGATSAVAFEPGVPTTGDAGAGVMSNFGIGAQSNESAFFFGDIALVVLAQGPLTQDQIDRMRAWIVERIGL